MPTFKWLFLNNLRSETLEQIQNLVPHRLMSRLKSKTTPGDTLRTRLYSSPIDVWTQKMDMDGDGGRREFGLRGQRRGTGSDKGTAANPLCGYHAPGLKKSPEDRIADPDGDLALRHVCSSLEQDFSSSSSAVPSWRHLFSHQSRPAPLEKADLTPVRLSHTLVISQRLIPSLMTLWREPLTGAE
jgi:hypothetical protein